MAYVTGDIIAASDINGFITVINNVWNIGFATRGYGQSDTLTPVTIGSIINGTHWYNMLPKLTTISLHQSNAADAALPISSEFNVGQTVEAFAQTGVPAKDLSGAVTTIDTNRLTAHANSLTAFSGTSSTRVTSWGTSVPQLIHEVSVDFGSVNAARYFFNSGGFFSFSASRTGGSANAQNTAWTTVLNGMGVIKFNYAGTTTTGSGTGSGIGYYGLTTGYQRLFIDTVGAYGVQDYAIYAKTDAVGGINGGNGSVITFKIEFTEGGNVLVDGSLASVIAFTKATTYLTVGSPTFTTLTPLTTP